MTFLVRLADGVFIVVLSSIAIIARYADKNLVASSSPGLEENASIFITNKVNDGSRVS